MIAGIVVAGVIGLALGYYALVWIAGPTGDFLNIAQFLPSALLPSDMRPAIVVRTDADERGEIQARFTEPADQREPGEISSRAGDLTASREPPPFDGTTAQPLAGSPVPPPGQLVSPPSFTPDELAVALRTAEDAQPKLVEGDLNDGQEVQRAKGLGYSLLCDLAQKSTFVDATSRADYVNSLASKVQGLFRGTLADQQTRAEVAVIVRKWIDSPYRKHGGVFFGGTLALHVDKGSVVECQFDLGNGQMLTVLAPAAAAAQLAESSHPLGVVGWIVDNPAAHVSGYSGDARQAIWAGQLIPLE
jgi:hypothetical protein